MSRLLLLTANAFVFNAPEQPVHKMTHALKVFAMKELEALCGDPFGDPTTHDAGG